MAGLSYTYSPENIKEAGKDRMRFELGDIMTEGQADTTALSDEEIQAALDTYPGSWKRAKLMLLESLCRRFAYEVDTKTDSLWLYMQERAKLWRTDYEQLKKEVQAGSCSVPQTGGSKGNSSSPPYFYSGLHKNRRTGDIW